MSIIKRKIVAKGHGSLKPSYFVVHSTANVGATAANHISYWSRNPDYAVHLVSDWKVCYQAVPYNKLCWQVGNGNAYVEGIEICEAKNRADFNKGIEIAAEAVAERLKAHGWTTKQLVTHNWCSKKWGGSDHVDPLPYFKRWGYSWDKFEALVRKKMGGSSASSSASSAKAKTASFSAKYRANVAGTWLDEMKNMKDTSGGSDDYAGIFGRNIGYISCNAKKYRVKTKAGWLDYVSSYKPSDLNSGAAGNGNAIYGVDIQDSRIKYQIHSKGGKWSDWTQGSCTSKAAIDGIRMKSV